MATLFLTCGLPGSGKTTLAKQIEHERPALRLTADEWLVELFGPEPEPPEIQKGAPSERRDAVEALQWALAARALGARRRRGDRLGRVEPGRSVRLSGARKSAGCETRRLLPRRASATRLVRRPGGAQRKPAARNVSGWDEQYLDLWSTWFERPTEDELREQ